MLSTDKLELLEDESLKRLLTAYPAAVESLKKWEDNLEKVVLNIQRPLIEEYISLTDLLPSDDSHFAQIKSRAIRSDYAGLSNDIRWQNVLYHRYWTLGELEEVAKKLKQLSQQILDFIEAELAN